MNTYVLSLPLMKRIKGRTITTDGGCWEFQGYRRRGYGRIWHDGKIHTVHRLVAVLCLGLDPDDYTLDACHQCDNRSCCNPDHIFLGTRAENVSDMVSKGRWGPPRVQPAKYPRTRECAICSAVYSPPSNHRGRSRVCSPECLAALRSANRRDWGSKLSTEQVVAIRLDLDAGMQGVRVAKKYGISKSHVSNIRNGKAWPT